MIKGCNANMWQLKKILWSLFTVNNLPDAVLEVDNSGEIKCYNKKAAQLLGLDENENSINFSSVFENGMEYIIKSDKYQKPVAVNTSDKNVKFYYELNAAKNLSGYTVTLRDLTALTSEIHNDEKIKRFNGEKNAMLALIENDIKSPITSISGFSKGLLDGLGGKLTEKQEKYIKIINGNIDELYGFLDKFIEFSKAESSICQQDFKIADITEIIKNISKDFYPVTEAKNLYFDIDYDSVQKFNIYTDINAIKTAYRNILQISTDATESGGITVSIFHPDENMRNHYNIEAQKESSYIAIVIKDSSNGVGADELKHMCDPYFNLNNDKKDLLRAFELGTASILINRTGGFIDIITETGYGMKYTIVIPTEKANNE